MHRGTVASVSEFVRAENQGDGGEVDEQNVLVALLLAWCKDKYTIVSARWDALKGKEEKQLTVEQERVAQMADIIRTYRGIPEDEEVDPDLSWVDHVLFDVGMSIVILLNTLVIGLETDLDEGESRGVIWILLEILFVGIFLSEVGVKVWYHKLGILWVIQTPMNMMITFIVCMACIDLLVLFPLQAAGVVDAKGVLRMLSLIRIVGLLRLLRIIKQYNSLEELRLVIQGMLDSFQTIAWVVVLLIIFLYICAIITTNTIGHNTEVYGRYRKLSGGWDHEELFGSVGRSMYTLLQVMTLDSWSSGVARHVIENQWYMSIFFLLFLLLSTHGILNVVVSVIVEHTLTAAQINESRRKIREDRKRKEELERITEIFKLADEDGSGVLDLEEFLKNLQKPEVHWALAEVGLPAADATRLFDAIDGSGTRTLNCDEFIAGCTKLRGPAQSIDLLAIQAQADALAMKMDLLSQSLNESERMMNAVDMVTMRITRRFAPAVLGTRQRIAHSKGGSEPVVPPKRTRPGLQEDVDLSIGNRPALPIFPNLLK